MNRKKYLATCRFFAAQVDTDERGHHHVRRADHREVHRAGDSESCAVERVQVGGTVIAKVKFQCEKCDASQIIDGPGTWGRIQNALHQAGWKVVIDRERSMHYCPTCNAEM